MNKYNQKLNIAFYGLQAFTILALGVMFVPTEASADRAGYVTPYNSTKWATVRDNSAGVNTNTEYSDAPTIYSGNTNAYAPQATTTTTTVRKAAPATNKVATTSTADEPVKTAEDVKELAANVIYGSNSFMPSGLVQWILLAILILLIVILVRRVFRGEQNYHDTPLKHA